MVLFLCGNMYFSSSHSASLPPDRSLLEKSLLFISVGNSCSSVAFLITLCCFSHSRLCVLLLGPAPEGDRHADSTLGLPQQPVNRQRQQQQPRHTDPGVFQLHAVHQQVSTPHSQTPPSHSHTHHTEKEPLA